MQQQTCTQQVEQYICSRLARNPLARVSCAEYLGEFTAEDSEYGFTKGGDLTRLRPCWSICTYVKSVFMASSASIAWQVSRSICLMLQVCVCAIFTYVMHCPIRRDAVADLEIRERQHPGRCADGKSRGFSRLPCTLRDRQWRVRRVIISDLCPRMSRICRFHTVQSRLRVRSSCVHNRSWYAPEQQACAASCALEDHISATLLPKVPQADDQSQL